MTKQEAQRKLDEVTSEGLGFCPEINGGCQRACVCYVSGKVIDDGNNNYHIITPYCRHKFLDVRHKMLTK